MKSEKMGDSCLTSDISHWDSPEVVMSLFRHQRLDLRLLLFIGVLPILTYAQDSDLATPDSLKPADDVAEVDWNHPKYFLEVTEYHDKRSLPILHSRAENSVSLSAHKIQASTSSTPVRSFVETVNAEIDLDSRILFEFDREWMLENGT